MSPKRRFLQSFRRGPIYLATAILAFCLVSCTSKPESTLQKQGIQVESVRVTGAGHFVDFRFRVLDAEKAATLLDRSNEAVLIDQATKTELPVPITKLGPIRQITRKPEKNRVYFILFTNPANLVSSGKQVSIRIGDFEAKDIVVQ